MWTLQKIVHSLRASVMGSRALVLIPSFCLPALTLPFYLAVLRAFYGDASRRGRRQASRKVFLAKVYAYYMQGGWVYNSSQYFCFEIEC